jgi:hypothetical protein
MKMSQQRCLGFPGAGGSLLVVVAVDVVVGTLRGGSGVDVGDAGGVVRSLERGGSGVPDGLPGEVEPPGEGGSSGVVDAGGLVPGARGLVDPGVPAVASVVVVGAVAPADCAEPAARGVGPGVPGWVAGALGPPCGAEVASGVSLTEVDVLRSADSGPALTPGVPDGCSWADALVVSGLLSGHSRTVVVPPSTRNGTSRRAARRRFRRRRTASCWARISARMADQGSPRKGRPPAEPPGDGPLR